ncbi:hypothetical protein LRP67_08020 [Nocardioides sp. cx-169]|uniref:hypothetical protein n=1 Tax=Nocardioides sp. cx-169 TaxID=2899080 RepID=UPI001E36021C|nr:hypothetical protein [Nocardioides sp. cx-169]MCD4534023.1 hypothetical protein [Nocardioides sp. cx-169]
MTARASGFLGRAETNPVFAAWSLLFLALSGAGREPHGDAVDRRRLTGVLRGQMGNHVT